MKQLDPLSPDLFARLLYEGWDKLTKGDHAAASTVFNRSAKLAMMELPAKSEVKAGMLSDCALGLFAAGREHRKDAIKVLNAALETFENEEKWSLERGRVHRQLSAVYESMQMWSDAAHHLRKSIKLFQHVLHAEERLEIA